MHPRMKALLGVLVFTLVCIGTMIGVSAYITTQAYNARYVGDVQAELISSPEPLIGTFNTVYGVSAMAVVKDAEKHQELIGQQLPIVLDPQWQTLEPGQKMFLSSCELVRQTLRNCTVIRVE